MSRKYPAGYKPNVCIASFTLKYFDKKHEKKIRSERKDIQRKAIEDYVKSVKVDLYPLVLNEQNEFPTEKSKQSCLRAVFLYMNIKDNFDEQIATVRDIVVKSSSKVNYEFDELIH